MPITDLLGKYLVRIERVWDRYGEELHFHDNGGRHWRMWHPQDCCEQVWIEDICGELNDLLYVSRDSAITLAEETSNQGEVGDSESATWTFYHLGNPKGRVTIRWCGTSSGYYSEEVSFEEIVSPEAR